MVNWAIDRPLFSSKTRFPTSGDFAVYESAQFDSPARKHRHAGAWSGPGAQFLHLPGAIRIRGSNWISTTTISATFRPLIRRWSAPDLLDKFLFQGFSAGGRVEVCKQVCVSTNLGRSSRTGDPNASLNEMYGLTFGRLPWLQLRADAHYARFNSSFGSGSYEVRFSLPAAERQPAAGGPRRAAELQFRRHHQQPVARLSPALWRRRWGRTITCREVSPPTAAS